MAAKSQIVLRLIVGLYFCLGSNRRARGVNMTQSWVTKLSGYYFFKVTRYVSTGIGFASRTISVRRFVWICLDSYRRALGGL